MSFLSGIAIPSSGNIPLSVTLSGYSDYLGITNWHWDLDDGTIVDGQIIEVEYTQSGVYNPIVTINGFDGDWYTIWATGEITVYDVVTITGQVEGTDFIYSFPTFYDYFSGEVYGVGKTQGDLSFYFTSTAGPPTSSGLIKKGIKPLLTNKARYPYKIPSDTIVSKIDFLKNGKLSYISGIPIELWMNYLGEWAKVEDGLTDRHGSCYITHPTVGVPRITNCLGVAKATYNNAEYVSNVMRYNFILGQGVVIIDAGSCTEIITDRSGFDIWDSQIIRTTVIDRMYGG